jgi:uncharacterized protein YbjT (DUF2867 family)
MRVLVTGATGYIGGRLAPLLIRRGHQVRCLTRSRRRLADVPWAAEAEVVEGDVLRPETLPAALAGVDAVYYLIHSLAGRDFEARDRRGAANLADAARTAEVRRIVYLGGPKPLAGGESAHLRSREEVARILLESGVPTVVLRAAVILGSGSASFEMLRYLTERLPAMVTPRWVHNRVQPIAIGDVLHYLAGVVELPPSVHRDFDIGGPEVLTFGEMMRRYARQAGLPRRLIVPVRALTPSLSSHWVGLVTPVPGRLARPLVESLVHEAVCRDRDIARHVPDPPGGLTDVDTAIRLALTRLATGEVDAGWSVERPADPLPTDPGWAGGTVHTDRRSVEVAAPPERLWRAVEDVAARADRYLSPMAWSIRRIERADRGGRLRLWARARGLGRAWLEMRVAPCDGGSRYEQRAVFVPRGLSGQLYWYAGAPLHPAVFGGIAQAVARTAGQAVRT